MRPQSLEYTQGDAPVARWHWHVAQVRSAVSSIANAWSGQLVSLEPLDEPQQTG